MDHTWRPTWARKAHSLEPKVSYDIDYAIRSWLSSYLLGAAKIGVVPFN